jgi:hypothetical protein
VATNTLDASDLTVSTHDMGLRISHRICAEALRAATRANERGGSARPDPQVAVSPSYLLALSDWDEH